MRSKKSLFAAAWFMLPLFLASCSGMIKSQSAVPGVPGDSSQASAKSDSLAKAASSDDDDDRDDGDVSPKKSDEKTASDIENLTIDEVIRIEEPNAQSLYDNSRYDFPITVNSKVEGWIDYFTGRGRQHMERYLGRSSRYIPVMKQILRKAGMPEDLVFLALIESGFNLRAKSRARAVGPWQFIKETGRRYGLRVDGWIDERRDPIRSTEAAAKYLKDLYLMFESWYLAASAYNAGEYKIMRAIEELKTNNYWRICQTRIFRRETKDYVPKLIAAAIIAKNPARYGFDDISYLDPLEFDTITVDFPIQLKEMAKLVDAPEEDIEDLNPELRRAMIPPGAGPYEVRIPVGSRVLAERGLAAIRSKIETSTDMPTQHTVQAGETVASVSRRYRIRATELANVNNLNPRERLVPGSKLIIPKASAAAASRGNNRVRRQVSNEGGHAAFVSHIVKRGETLWSIAEKYNCTIQDIFRWNKLRKSRIQPGRRLRIKAGNADSDET